MYVATEPHAVDFTCMQDFSNMLFPAMQAMQGAFGTALSTLGLTPAQLVPIASNFRFQHPDPLDARQCQAPDHLVPPWS